MVYVALGVLEILTRPLLRPNLRESELLLIGLYSRHLALRMWRQRRLRRVWDVQFNDERAAGTTRRIVTRGLVEYVCWGVELVKPIRQRSCRQLYPSAREATNGPASTNIIINVNRKTQSQQTISGRRRHPVRNGATNGSPIHSHK